MVSKVFVFKLIFIKTGNAWGFKLPSNGSSYSIQFITMPNDFLMTEKYDL